MGEIPGGGMLCASMCATPIFLWVLMMVCEGVVHEQVRSLFLALDG